MPDPKLFPEPGFIQVNAQGVPVRVNLVIGGVDLAGVNVNNFPSTVGGAQAQLLVSGGQCYPLTVTHVHPCVIPLFGSGSPVRMLAVSASVGEAIPCPPRKGFPAIGLGEIEVTVTNDQGIPVQRQTYDATEETV